jgi:hypothetical protein
MSPILAAQGAQQLISVLQRLSIARSNSQPQSQPDNPTASTAVTDPRASAPRIPKAAGELLFAVHAPETLYRIWAACKGFTPSFTHFDGQRVIIHGLMHPQTALERQKVPPSSTFTTAASHFPSFAEAQQLGVGGLFFDPQLQSLGVVCASSSLDDPRVLYVTDLQLSGKKNPVSAATFASGYLDKRKMKKPDQSRSWKLTQSGEVVDFFGSRLA